MSAYTEARARRLIKTGRIAQVDGNTWQAAGSKEGTMYVILLEPRHCDCLGFSFRRDCSHIRAVELVMSVGAAP